MQSGKNGLHFLRPVLKILLGFAPNRRAGCPHPAARFGTKPNRVFRTRRKKSSPFLPGLISCLEIQNHTDRNLSLIHI